MFPSAEKNLKPNRKFLQNMQYLMGSKILITHKTSVHFILSTKTLSNENNEIARNKMKINYTLQCQTLKLKGLM